jgi:DNA repair exonuclease SbcCD ATPase subunit
MANPDNSTELVRAVRDAFRKQKDTLDQQMDLRVARVEADTAKRTARLALWGALIAAVLGMIGGVLAPFATQWAKDPNTRRKEASDAALAKEEAQEKLEKKLSEFNAERDRLRSDISALQESVKRLTASPGAANAVDPNAAERSRLNDLIATLRASLGALDSRIEKLRADLELVKNSTEPGIGQPSEAALAAQMERLNAAIRKLEQAQAERAKVETEMKESEAALAKLPPLANVQGASAVNNH